METSFICSVSILLYFSFDRVNYERWAPLCYEDCIALKKNFPQLDEGFVDSDFVVCQTLYKRSAIPMHTRKRTTNLPKFNQELSLSPAKKAVSTWNLIKHEKAKFIEFMSNNFCSIYDLINILLWKLDVIKKLCQIQLLTSCKEKILSTEKKHHS